MAKQSEVKVTYKAINQEFNRAIREMGTQVTSLNKEFRLQQEQMKLTASSTQKMEASLNKLNKEYELAKQKTKLVEEGLSAVRKQTGDNSKETQTWANKLLDAKKNEAFLKNAIDSTTKALEKEKASMSQAAQESAKRKEQLSQLKNEQEKLSQASDRITAKYRLETAELGNNVTKSSLLKVKKKELAEQMSNTSRQVANLEKQLSLAKTEYGANSREVNKLETELLQAKTAYQQYANELKKASDVMGRFSEKAKTIGSNLSSVGRSLTVGLTAPIIAGVGASVKAASDFESAFTGVKKTVDEVKDANGKTVVSYADLEKGIRNMAKEIPVSTAEIASVAEAAGQLGIRTGNVLGFTKTMIAMGESTNLSSEEAASSLAQLANIVQMPQDKFENLGSTIVALGNSMATTEADIVNMGQRLAATGHLVGLSTDQIMAMAATMSSLGINAEAGGSAMSRVMQKINTAVLDGGDGLTNFAQVSGLTAEEFAQKWKNDPAHAIIDFLKGLHKVKEAGGDVTGTLKDMGIESTVEIDAMQRLAGSGDLLSQALKTSSKAWRENTALSEEASKRYETFKSKLTIVKNKVTDLAIEFGGPLLDAISDVLDSLEPVFDYLDSIAKKFSNLSPDMQKIVTPLGVILVALGPVLIFIGKVVTALGAIGGLFAEGGVLATIVPWITGTLIPAIAAISAPVWIVIGVVGALIGAFIHFWNTSEDFRNAIGEIWNTISSVISSTVQTVVDFVTETWGIFTDWWTDNHELISTTAENMWNGISELIQNVISFLEPYLQSAWDGIYTIITTAWEIITTGIQTGLTVILETIQLFMEIINGDWQSAWETFQSIISTIWEAIVSIISTFLNGVTQTISIAWGIIQSITSSIWNGIVGLLSGLWSGISSTASSIFNGISNFISGIWNSITNTTSRTWNSISSTVLNVISQMSSTVSSVFSGISRTVSSIWSGIRSTIKGAIDGAVGAVRSAIGTLKSIMNFSWSLPHLKLPHISISGSFSLDPPSVPSFGISWYKNGGIMMNPTVFGRNGNNMMVGGEAGPEAILPLTSKVLGGIGAGIAKAANLTTNSYGDNHIVVNATVSNDYDVERMIEQIDYELGKREVLLSRGVGD